MTTAPANRDREGAGVVPKPTRSLTVAVRPGGSRPRSPGTAAHLPDRSDPAICVIRVSNNSRCRHPHSGSLEQG